jgi:hypothetical protein
MVPAVVPVMPMLANWWRRNFQGYLDSKRGRT